MKCEPLPGQRPHRITAIEVGDLIRLDTEKPATSSLSGIEFETDCGSVLLTYHLLNRARIAWQVMQPGPPIESPLPGCLVVRYYNAAHSYSHKGLWYITPERGYAIYLLTDTWWVTEEDVITAQKVRVRRGSGRPKRPYHLAKRPYLLKSPSTLPAAKSGSKLDDLPDDELLDEDSPPGDKPEVQLITPMGEITKTLADVTSKIQRGKLAKGGKSDR